MTWRGMACVSCAMFALLAGTPRARAENGRDFAGFYHLTNVVEAGDQVFLTLSLEIFNYSGADVTNARVSLVDSVTPGRNHGAFDPVDVPYRGSQRLSANFAVPLSDYALWPDGVPRLSVEFVGDGETQARAIELLRFPLGEGGQ